jgi:hypothetical protein
MYYSHDLEVFTYCELCERLWTAARIEGTSFIPCRECWERYLVVHEPEVDELL